MPVEVQVLVGNDCWDDDVLAYTERCPRTPRSIDNNNKYFQEKAKDLRK